MDWSNNFPSPKFRKRYEEKCFKHFIKLRNHDDCRIKYLICSHKISVSYFYDDEELFDVNKDIDILRQFFKKCKFDINGWNTTGEIGINNSTKNNYSDILLNSEFKFLTRLDIKKRYFFFLANKS